MKESNNVSINNLDQDVHKEHHGFISFWLTFLTLAAVANAGVYLLVNSGIMSISIVFLSLISIVGIVMIFNFKMLGFILFALAKVAIIGIFISFGEPQIMLNVIGVFILYLVLQLKNKEIGKSTWEQLV